MDYRFAGKRRTLALGVYPVVTLSSARTQREQARLLLAQGADPSASKQRTKRLIKLAGENDVRGGQSGMACKPAQQAVSEILWAASCAADPLGLTVDGSDIRPNMSYGRRGGVNLKTSMETSRYGAYRQSARRLKREHIVPLAPQAVAVLRELRALPDF